MEYCTSDTGGLWGEGVDEGTDIQSIYFVERFTDSRRHWLINWSVFGVTKTRKKASEEGSRDL